VNLAAATTRVLFGTDGIRATFGDWPLEQNTVQRIGYELGRLLAEESTSPAVLIAGDTRASTPTLSGWIADGLRVAGSELHYGGTLPTPAVALLTRQMMLPAGIAVSASHNPATDNGIKFFDGQGRKWSRSLEQRLERRIASPGHSDFASLPLPTWNAIFAKQYVDFLVGLLPVATCLAGMRVVIDGAHGAATPLLEEICGRLQLDATLLHSTPDGERINKDCGSTHPEVVASAVREHGAELGLTFDGDADRVLLVDGDGRIRDGDAILYLWARHLFREGKLDPPRIVATSMSNLGLDHALAEEGIEVERCDVGDREVVHTMSRDHLTLGGEQSGHIVNLGLTTTGDGLLTALQLATIVRQSGRSLAQNLEGFRTFPQVLRNVRVRDKPSLESIPEIVAIRDDVEAALGADGRLVLRYSGTEPLARVMIEGPERDLIEQLAARMCGAIERELGAAPDAQRETST